MKEHNYMDLAIEKSMESVKNGGGPFGAVIVKDNKIICALSNSVVPDKDPTAHAEVNAIRKACKELGTHDLKGCQIYSSCEPCPMCLASIYWARIDELYFANSREDAKTINFDDEFLYTEIPKPIQQRFIKTVKVSNEKAIEAFKMWETKMDKAHY